MRSVATSSNASSMAYKSRTLPRPSSGVAPRLVVRRAVTGRAFRWAILILQSSRQRLALSMRGGLLRREKILSTFPTLPCDGRHGLDLRDERHSNCQQGSSGCSKKITLESGDTRQLWKGEAAYSLVSAGIASSRV